MTFAGKSRPYPLKCSGWIAFAIYFALSLLFFGRGLIGHLSDRYVGTGTDPGLFIFFLEWWKYVFTHHVNPLFTYLQWAPDGSNLAWATCIPLFGIAAIPLTAVLGPIATFNLLTLLSLPLAAWAAFLLCRYLSSSPCAALIGGYAFGFSPWMLSHLLGHLTVLMIFPVPLMALVTLRRLNGEIGARAFAITLTIWIVVLFLCWPEAVATATLFGGIAIAIAWLTAPPLRKSLLRLVLPTSLAYLAGAAILSPYLYYFFAFGQPAFPGGLTQIVSIHPLNFLIPSPVNLLGAFPLLTSLLRGHVYETGAYIALPIILIVVSYARNNWIDWRCRLLVNLFLIVAVASMGAKLDLPGHRSIPLPWGIVSHLPLIDKALPARFSIYAFLLLAVLLSLWVSDAAVRMNLRLAGACAVAVLTLPNLNRTFWTTPVDTPAFFSSGDYMQYIAPGDNVLILPYASFGNSNTWQAAAGFYFRMAGGYLGQPPIPVDYLPYFPVIYDFYNLAESPFASEMLKVFLVQKEVKEIVVADCGAQLWKINFKGGLLFPEPSQFDRDESLAIHSLFGTLGVAPIQTGGVSLYKVPLNRLAIYKSIDPNVLEARIVSYQLDTLFDAAAKYLAGGRPLTALNPVEAQRLGLLPPRWIAGIGIYNPHSPIQNGLVISATNNGDVLIGVVGARGTIEKLAEKYRTYAKVAEIWSMMRSTAWVESSRWILLLECDREQVARAAEFARQNLSAFRNGPPPSAVTPDAPASHR